MSERGAPKRSTIFGLTVGAAALVWLLYIWNSKLTDQSALVIYFGRPRDIAAYFRAEAPILLASSFWCVFVASVSLMLSGALSVALLVLGLSSNGRLSMIERSVAALQTVPVLVIVTVSLLVETQLFAVIGAKLSATWYCLVPVTIALMFPPLANGAAAIRRTPVQLKAMLRLWDAPKYWRIRQIYLPLAIPDILTGVRSSATWAVGATLIAEGLLNGVDGDSATLGHFLVRPFSSSASPGRTPAVIMLATLLGFAVYLIFVLLQRYAENRWRGRAATAEADYPFQSNTQRHPGAAGEYKQ